LQRLPATGHQFFSLRAGKNIQQMSILGAVAARPGDVKTAPVTVQVALLEGPDPREVDESNNQSLDDVLRGPVRQDANEIPGPVFASYFDLFEHEVVEHLAGVFHQARVVEFGHQVFEWSANIGGDEGNDFLRLVGVAFDAQAVVEKNGSDVSAVQE